MNPGKLAQARRLYHHVCHGGTLKPSDISFMVRALEQAYDEIQEQEKIIQQLRLPRMHK